MEQVWRVAPLVALRVWSEATGLRTELNAAGRAWSLEHGSVDADWQRLAEDRCLPEASGASEVDVQIGAPGRTMCCRSVKLPDGALLWLTPPVLPDESVSLAAQLDAVQDFGRMGLFTRNLRTGRGYWDRHVFRIVGLPETAEAPDVEAFIQSCVHPDDATELRQGFALALKTAGRGRTRYRVVHPDGELRHLLSIYEVRTGADGLLDRMVGVMLDETEAVASVRTERRASTYLERAIDLAGISVWRIDDATQRIHFKILGNWLSWLAGTATEAGGIPLERLRETVHPDDRGAIEAAADEARRSGEVVDVIARYADPGSTGWRTLLTRRVAEHDERGAVTGLAGVSLDLSELMAERARADELTERARLACEAIGVGFWSRDQDSGSVYWDEQMMAMHHRAPHEGAPPLEEWIDRHVHVADRAWVEASRRRSAACWEPRSEVSFRIPAPDGGERWVRAWTRRVIRGGRRLSFGMHIDVTEQHCAELALQRERDRYRFAVDAAGVGVWERNIDGPERFWNDAMYRLRGLDPSDPRSTRELSVLSSHPDDQQAMDELVQRHLATGEPYSTELRVTWPDGTRRWLATRGRKLDDPSRPGRVMAGINIDITERKQADALRQEMLNAEQASRDKSAFLARVSHELRTPLNAIIGFTDLLIHDLDPQAGASTAQRLDHIRSSSRHLLALIDDVLELSRLDAVAALPLRDPVLLAPVLAEALQWVAGLARQAGVTLVGADVGSVVVLGERRRLGQVLANLLTNAIKYNHSGGWVRVALQRQASDGLLGIVVADGGRGIGAADLARIFDPFERAGAEREAIEGTGIGLTITRQLVLRMGGRIEVRSVPGEGSEFSVCLHEAPPAGADVAASAAALAAAVAVETRVLRPLVVLCVEDNPVNLQLVRELFGLRPAHLLHTAENGLDAVAWAPAMAPDVVLLDMQLPDIDGAEVMRRLRGRPELARTRFIALSANAMPDHVSQAMGQGFDDYWTKPIDFGQFLAGLDSLAAGAAGAA